TGERLPSFSVRLDTPPSGDAAIAAQLAHASAERYGRPSLDVELDLQAAAERVQGPRVGAQQAGETDENPKIPAGGATASVRVATGGEVPGRSPNRSRRKATNAARKRNRAETVSDGVRDRGEGESTAA